MANSSKSFRTNSFAFVFCVGALTLTHLAVAQHPAPAQAASSAKPDGEKLFDALKTLAGRWSGRVTTNPHNPDIEGPIQVTLRLASRGTALVHEIAPGGVPEPTMIYLDNDRLTLLHYCEAGNRPRLVARNSPDQKTVEFDFADLSGDKSPAYLQHFVFALVNADHHIEDWTFLMPDGNSLHAHFDLQRAKESVPPPSK